MKMPNKSAFQLRCYLAPLFAALYIMIAVEAKADSVDSSPKQAKTEFTFESATALLKPPNTASPRAVLKSFIENMDLAYSELMRAHRKNLQTPGFFTSKAVKLMARQAEEHFQSGVECLNLSAVPNNLRKSTGYEGAIMLKEIFDRIDLPPYTAIPDEKAIDEEEDTDKKADMVRWRIPNTDIIIDLVEEGPREGEYLFTPETVARLEEFYNKVKDYPYKLNARVSHDFYDFYATSAGRLLPPKWNSWLPTWTVRSYLDQTLWQWCALLILPLGVLLLVWWLVRWWYQKTADLSSGKKTGGWLFILLITVGIVSLVNYILDEHVNITGAVLVFIDNTLQKIFIVFFSWTDPMGVYQSPNTRTHWRRRNSPERSCRRRGCRRFAG